MTGSPTQPLVAVLTPAFNAARYLDEAIRSVETQTYPHWRLIIVDDGSTDDTAAIAARHTAADPRISLIRQPNGGISAARNACLAQVPAAAAYAINFDADDRLAPEALAGLVAYMESHPAAGAVLCGARTMDGNGRISGARRTLRFRRRAGLPWPMRGRGAIPFFNFYCGYGVGPFALFRAAALRAAGPYDPALISCEDADVFCRLALATEVHQIPDRLYDYRWHATNSSHYDERNRRALELFRAKWRGYEPRTPAEVRLLAQARAFFSGPHVAILNTKLAVAAVRERRGLGAAARHLRIALAALLRRTPR
jgi:glycosyltransferase involved in cell wall biosynthesis